MDLMQSFRDLKFSYREKIDGCDKMLNTDRKHAKN